MKKLGRGLGAILEDVEAGYLKSIPNKGVQEIEISKIKPNPYQPRKIFNENAIKELASSIEKHGLMQPVIVIKDKENYILVAGERRLKAVKSLNRSKIKAIIADISLKDLREYALIENIQREDLNPLEIAYSLKALIDEHGFTHEELSKNIGKSRSYITNLLRLLNLPKYVQDKISQNKITFGHAKILSGLDENEMKDVVDNIEKNSLNVREAERLISKIKKGEKENEEINKDLITLAEKLKNMGIKINIGSNYVKLMFKNEKDFQNLRKVIEKLS